MIAEDEQISTTQGPVFRPGDDGYDEERSGYNGIVTHAPAVIVGAAEAGDVVAAVRYARARGMSVGVHLTGHGISVPADGVLISTRRMTGIEIDPVAGTARVQAGVIARDLVGATAEHGLAPLNGSAPAVGVVGYHLGGGVPLLGRRHGYASDRVRWIEVVTADGELRRVGPGDDADLFWALLGGKGNFGVVTEIEIDLVDIASVTVTGGGLWFTGENIEPAVRAYARWAARAPEAMGSSVLLMTLPDIPFIPEPIRGVPSAHIRVLHTGDGAEAEALVEDLRSAAPRAQDTVGVMSYADVGTIHNEPEGPVIFEASNTLLAEFDDAAVTTLLAHAGADSGAPFLVELRHLGGRLSPASHRQGATGRQDGAFTLYTGQALADVADRDAAATTQRAMHDAMAPWSTGGVCPSFLSGPAVTLEDYRSGFAGDDFARLQLLKARFDPANMYRVNHNIPPGTE